MSEQPNAIGAGSQRLNVFWERLLRATQPDQVFGKPSVQGDYTVITASEIIAVGGMGYGAASTGDSQKDADGGGSGGYASGRPVAVISVNARGVQVEPIVDVSKVGLALITLLGSFAFMVLRMRGRK